MLIIKNFGLVFLTDEILIMELLNISFLFRPMTVMTRMRRNQVIQTFLVWIFMQIYYTYNIQGVSVKSTFLEFLGKAGSYFPKTFLNY